MVAVFEACLQQLGLSFKRMSLAKYPGSTHWHIQRPGEKGTLEATWWPSEERLWLSVHANRRGDWQAAVIGEISDLFHAEGRGFAGVAEGEAPS